MAKGKERKVFQPTRDWYLAREQNRKFEWVAMDDGSEVCVWAATVKDALDLASISKPPPAFANGHDDTDSRALMVQSIISTCHDGEPPDGKRLFSFENLWAIHALTVAEMNRILEAQARTNGTGQEVAERLEGFIGRTMAGDSSTSATGASKSSIGSRKS